MTSLKILRLAIVTLVIISSAACQKNRSIVDPPPPTRALHAAETALLGRWYVEERRDSTWSWTGSDTSIYVTTETKYSGAYNLAFSSYLAFVDSLPRDLSPLQLTDGLKSAANPGYWYFDSSQNRVVMNIGTVISNTDSSLVIRLKPPMELITGSHQRVTYYSLKR